AANNYESTNQCYPSGSYSNYNGGPPDITCSKPGSVARCTNPENFSCFVRVLPFTEQAAMYNAVNFNFTSSNNENITIAGVKLNILTCPSDPDVDPVLISAKTPGT